MYYEYNNKQVGNSKDTLFTYTKKQSNEIKLEILLV